MALRDVIPAIMFKSDMKINSTKYKKNLTDFEEARKYVHEYKRLEAFSDNIIVYGLTRCEWHHYVKI